MDPKDLRVTLNVLLVMLMFEAALLCNRDKSVDSWKSYNARPGEETYNRAMAYTQAYLKEKGHRFKNDEPIEANVLDSKKGNAGGSQCFKVKLRILNLDEPESETYTCTTTFGLRNGWFHDNTKCHVLVN